MFKKTFIILLLLVISCCALTKTIHEDPKTIFIRGIEIKLPLGMRDITETKNVTFAPFSKDLARLLFVFDENEYYMLSFIRTESEIYPFILMSNIMKKDRWFYYENKIPREITRKEAENILYNKLTKEVYV